MMIPLFLVFHVLPESASVEAGYKVKNSPLQSRQLVPRSLGEGGSPRYCLNYGDLQGEGGCEVAKTFFKKNPNPNEKNPKLKKIPNYHRLFN